MKTAVLFVFVSGWAFAQSSSSDPQATQTLLSEVRGLRHDLQVTAAAIQRVQLVMFRMQAAATSLARATQRRDEAKNACDFIPPQRRALTMQIEQAETRLRAQSSVGDARGSEEISRLKEFLGNLAAQEEHCQTTLIDAEAQLRSEQAKMNDLQDQMDKLDRTLAEMARR